MAIARHATHGCVWRSLRGTSATPATFVSSAALRCNAPLRESLGAGGVGEWVALRLSLDVDDAEAASVAELSVLYIDTDFPPRVQRVYPPFGPVHAASRVHLYGLNLAPVGADLRCQFGVAPPTRGGWRGNYTIECVAPPGRFQFPSALARGEAVDDTAAIGATLISRIANWRQTNQK